MRRREGSVLMGVVPAQARHRHKFRAPSGSDVTFTFAGAALVSMEVSASLAKTAVKSGYCSQLRSPKAISRTGFPNLETSSFRGMPRCRSMTTVFARRAPLFVWYGVRWAQPECRGRAATQSSAFRQQPFVDFRVDMADIAALNQFLIKEEIEARPELPGLAAGGYSFRAEKSRGLPHLSLRSRQQHKSVPPPRAELMPLSTRRAPPLSSR